MKIGDKFVCIKVRKHNSSEWNSKYILEGNWPVAGQVYVLKHVYFHKPTNQIGLGMINSSVFDRPTGIELGWDSASFRSLDEMQMEAKLAETLKIS